MAKTSQSIPTPEPVPHPNKLRLHNSPSQLQNQQPKQPLLAFGLLPKHPHTYRPRPNTLPGQVWAPCSFSQGRNQPRGCLLVISIYQARDLITPSPKRCPCHPVYILDEPLPPLLPGPDGEAPGTSHLSVPLRLGAGLRTQ